MCYTCDLLIIIHCDLLSVIGQRLNFVLLLLLDLTDSLDIFAGDGDNRYWLIIGCLNFIFALVI